jgi:signal transduction histidine kinase/ligand-binding sensor domain-containing protein/DNA-binding response OmpR family regulator
MQKQFFLYLLFISCSIFAQNEYNQMYFKHYSVENGLSQSWVKCIYQDYLGLMWFGTIDGLNQFDGYKFKVYKRNPKSSKSLRNNDITNICSDINNNLWISTSTGLCLFNRKHEDFLYKPEWPEIYIASTLPNKTNLIIGSDEGLFSMDILTQEFKRIKINNIEILTEHYISCLENDQKGQIWIGTLEGLFTVDSSFKNLKKIDLNIPSNEKLRISTIKSDEENNIWIGTETSGLFQIKPNHVSSDYQVINHFVYSKSKRSISEGFIRTIEQDKFGNLWIGIENSGINIFNPNTPEDPLITAISDKKKDDNSITSNSIHDIFKDKHGNFWLGTYGGGINFFNHMGTSFVLYRHSAENPNSLIHNNVNVFYEYNNKIMIGTEGGLSVFNPQSNIFQNNGRTSPNNKNTLNDAIWAITSVSDDLIWIGTWANGISTYNTKTQTMKALAYEKLHKSNIFSIHEDSQGIIWIATMGNGLLAYNKSTHSIKTYLTDINDPYSLSNNWVRHICENSRNELWISTGSSIDLYNRDKDQFIHFTSNIYDTTTISGRGAYIIFEDSKQNMWFGTDVGLNYFVRKDSTFRYYQEDNGLPNNSVKGILEDGHGNLWLSTNKGISKMNNATNLPKNPTFQNFDVSDGLQGNEFNRRSALKTTNGYMLFGGTHGFNIFHPDSLHNNKNAPEIVFTGFLLLNKEVDFHAPNAPLKKHISIADKITLKYSQSVFSIEYAALDFINSDKNQYAYKLEGFDKNWNEVGNQRTANYTNINPGDYIFKVRASNNDAVWNSKGIQIAITILPPWYRTNLAYLFYILFIGFLIFAFRRMILMRLKLQHEIEIKQMEKEKLDEVHQVKTRFFTNISHEFRTPLTLIITPVEKMIHNTGFSTEINNQLHVILKNAKRMLRLINQFLDLSKIEAGYLKLSVHEGDLARFIQTISDIFSYQAKQKQLHYTFEMNRESIICWFDSDKIEKILYNLLSNAIKFTPEGNKVSLQVKFSDDNNFSDTFPGYFEIRVKDTGTGIKSSEKEKVFTRFHQSHDKMTKSSSGTGIGLSLVHGLVEKYKGYIDFESEHGKGSTFYVRLPMARKLFNEDSIINKSEEEYFSVLNNSHLINKQNNTSILTEGNTQSKNSNYTILIVEDNIELINYIMDQLGEKYKILTAFNGTEGIAIARKQLPDIIISDIMMPETDGIELCKTLKTDTKTSHIPIILLTAKAADENQVEGLETGADAYLTKPFSFDILEARINNLLISRKKLKELFIQKVNLEPKDITITSVDAKFLKNAMDLVEKNMANTEFSTDLMSSGMNMSRASLHRKLVALTGLPPSSFIRTLRIKRAATLLLKGQKTVSEVLYEVGIKSRSYFTKSFKEVYGYSPKEYVEREKNKPINNTEDT